MTVAEGIFCSFGECSLRGFSVCTNCTDFEVDTSGPSTCTVCGGSKVDAIVESPFDFLPLEDFLGALDLWVAGDVSPAVEVLETSFVIEVDLAVNVEGLGAESGRPDEAVEMVFDAIGGRKDAEINAKRR